MEKNGSLAYSIIPVLFGALLGIIVGWVFQHWVIITFFEEGKMKKLYLADGNVFGYKGIFGGTKSLFLKLEEEIDIGKSKDN